MWNVIFTALHYGPQLCRMAVPDSRYARLYDALVCGASLNQGSALQLFLDTGLIHIMVVSGAHLLFVERLMAWLPFRLRLSILALYCWLTGFGAPVVRAFARRLAVGFLDPYGFTTLQVEAVVSLAILIVWPPWLWSLSFQMSWLCALALQAPWKMSRWPPLDLSLRCYLFLLPLCPSSPMVIGWNALLGPLIGEAIFPLAMACFLFPALTPIGDEVWRGLLWILSAGPHGTPLILNWPSYAFWWVPAAVQLMLLIGDWKWRRALAFSPSY
jgi:ComEC/Rec2-related protein